MSSSLEAPILDLRASLKRPILWALGAGLLTAAITLCLPNHYRSEAKLLPVETKGLGGNLGGLASAAAAFGVSVPGGDSSDANFVDVLNSRWLRESLLKTEFRFHERTWRFGAEMARQQTLSDYLQVKNLDQGVRAVGTILSISRDLKSKVLTISAETNSPELSQQLVQRATRLLESFVLEKGRTRGGNKVLFAEQRLSEARTEYTAAEDEFRRFLEGNRNYQGSSDPTVRLRGARLEAEMRLKQQLLTTLAMSREQALMEEKNDVPILNVLDPGHVPIEKSGPVRSRIVLAVCFLVGGGLWTWWNREWIQAKVFESEASGSNAGSGTRELL